MESVAQNQSTLDRQPKQTDPAEISIRQNLEQELLSTPWAKESFIQLRSDQIDFFKKAIASPNSQEIKQQYSQLLKDLATTTKASIVEGVDHLKELDKEKGVIVIINHLGTAKLTSFSPGEIGLDLPIDQIEPFPIRHSGVSLIADQLDRPIHETAVVLPGPLYQIQESSGVITIPAAGEGRLQQLETSVEETLNQDKNALIVMYPEGGTSGKKNGGEAYDLDTFQSGAFVIAEHLNLPVLPVVQYFNPNIGLEIGILPPIQVSSEGNREYFKEIAKTTQDSMQSWLNSRK